MLFRPPGIAGLLTSVPPRRHTSASFGGYHAGYHAKIIEGEVGRRYRGGFGDRGEFEGKVAVS
jgi:hypothetical protein